MTYNCDQSNEMPTPAVALHWMARRLIYLPGSFPVLIWPYERALVIGPAQCCTCPGDST